MAAGEVYDDRPSGFRREDVVTVRAAAVRYGMSVANRYPHDEGCHLSELADRIELWLERAGV